MSVGESGSARSDVVERRWPRRGRGAASFSGTAGAIPMLIPLRTPPQTADSGSMGGGGPGGGNSNVTGLELHLWHVQAFTW